MRTSTITALAFVLTLDALAGCGDDSASSGSGGAGGATIASTGTSSPSGSTSTSSADGGGDGQGGGVGGGVGGGAGEGGAPSAVSSTGQGTSGDGGGGGAETSGEGGGGGEDEGVGGGAPSSPFEGFGSDTPGGDGQEVVHVTTLDFEGPGSLTEALWEGDRTIVFDVGGTIDTGGSNIYAQGISFVTIDGTTAPAPGITIDGGGLIIEAGSHDLVVKNLRVRNAGDDGIRVFDSHHVVFDHCSSAHNGDGSLDITESSHDVTVQWCLLGPAGSGVQLIAYGTRDVTLHHNLYASQQDSGVGERNPLLHAAPATSAVDYLMADIRNNLVWGWGRDAGDSYGYGTGLDYGATANVVANFYQTDGSQEGNALILNHESSGAEAYASGNVSGNGVDVDDEGNVAEPFDVALVTTDSACVAAARVRASAGAHPLDAWDQSVVDGISLDACD